MWYALRIRCVRSSFFFAPLGISGVGCASTWREIETPECMYFKIRTSCSLSAPVACSCRLRSETVVAPASRSNKSYVCAGLVSCFKPCTNKRRGCVVGIGAPPKQTGGFVHNFSTRLFLPGKKNKLHFYFFHTRSSFPLAGQRPRKNTTRVVIAPFVVANAQKILHTHTHTHAHTRTERRRRDGRGDGRKTGLPAASHTKNLKNTTHESNKKLHNHALGWGQQTGPPPPPHTHRT